MYRLTLLVLLQGFQALLTNQESQFCNIIVVYVPAHAIGPAVGIPSLAGQSGVAAWGAEEAELFAHHSRPADTAIQGKDRTMSNEHKMEAVVDKYSTVD